MYTNVHRQPGPARGGVHTQQGNKNSEMSQLNLLDRPFDMFTIRTVVVNLNKGRTCETNVPAKPSRPPICLFASCLLWDLGEILKTGRALRD